MLRTILGILASLPVVLRLVTGPGTRDPPTDFTPIVVNTWPFTDATQAAWDIVQSGGSALDAVEAACAQCETAQCDGTVGFGGSPDESGETTLDAMIMDGTTMEVGAVANLRHVKEAVKTARHVLQHTRHTLLAGLQASQFAQEMGLLITNLTTEESLKLHRRWLKNKCQPNYWRSNVTPDPANHCGPYSPIKRLSTEQGPSQNEYNSRITSTSHDTIAAVAIDKDGRMAVACSTNGAKNKIPGRVGDGAVPGGGAYVDGDVGGCGATGDGDVHLRFLPCFHVVEAMRRGAAPQEAAEAAIRRIVSRVGRTYVGAVVAVDTFGRHGAASYGWEFKYAYREEGSTNVTVVSVPPVALRHPSRQLPNSRVARY